MEEINNFEIDGLVQTLKETGIKGLMKYTDVLVLNHMCERGWISSERDKMIKLSKKYSNLEHHLEHLPLFEEKKNPNSLMYKRLRFLPVVPPGLEPGTT